MCFRWVLNGETKCQCQQSLSHICCVVLDDDSLRRFCEIEGYNLQEPVLSSEEKIVVKHFDEHHSRDMEGRFIVLLSRKVNVPPLGESKTQALHSVGLHHWSNLCERREPSRILREKGHAEQVPFDELDSTHREVYYLPMHASRL